MSAGADPGGGSCGCCAGLDAETPAPVDNPPGLSAVAYRAGVHAQFKESLLARLSDPELPALGGLTTRQDEDFTIALCDALATTLDVLTFYQERIANENLLRTATERRSVLELARLIGYELAAGVAASTHLAFTLQEVPGSPELAAGPVEVPVGTRAQSVPGPGEKPQTYETVEAVEARSEWNGIPAQWAVPWQRRAGDRELWLADVGNNVGAGDTILIVGKERLAHPKDERWDVRLVTAVEEDTVGQRTRVAWEDPLGPNGPQAGVTVHVFRQRAALFGHNAPDPRLLSTSGNKLGELLDNSDWKNFKLTDVIDLDSDYPKVVPGGWVALVPTATSSKAKTGLILADAVEHLSRRDFGLSAKTTRVHPDLTEPLADYGLRETTVLAQSEALAVHHIPLGYPLYGTTLALARLATGIDLGRALAVNGKRARLRLRDGVPPVTMPLSDGGSSTLKEGDEVRLLAAPERQSGGQWAVLSPGQFGDILRAPGSTVLRLAVLDRDGRRGTLTVAAAAVELVPAADEDEVVSEIVHVGDLPGSVAHDRDRTTFILAAALAHCYDRPTVRVNANVARATHGESANEVLGSADARVPNATFRLRQAPLTFVKAATPSGRRSTLEVRVNDLLWQEAESLYGRGPDERVYEVAIDAESQATVRFGDGVEGAVPPSGDHNVRASYRHGIGLEGNVAARQLTNLLSRPLGVTGVVNPEPSEGGEDPEDEARARENAPRTVLTLDRAVSVRDYQNFARSFSGIAKAHALWVPSGPSRGIFLTVAGEAGAAVSPGGDTHRFLEDALRRYGDPLTPLRLETYRDARFRVRMWVKVAADADATLVLPAVRAELERAFGFDARSFGQGVSVDEVAATAQAVPGVEAVNVIELQRTDVSAPSLEPHIFAALPIASLTSLPLAAELLTLDPRLLVVDVAP